MQEGVHFPSEFSALAFRNVLFSYPNKTAVALKGISFEINQNSKLALTGPSGSGKSSVLHLLLRMYDSKAGSILINGRPI